MKFPDYVLVSAIVLAGALMGAAPAVAQEAIHQHIRELIAEGAANQEKQVGDVVFTEIEEGETSTTTFKLDPEKSYWIYAACDDDCTDIDIQGEDGAGESVGADEDQDDAPMIYLTPGQSGSEVSVTVTMASCDAEICVAGLGLYEIAK